MQQQPEGVSGRKRPLVKERKKARRDDIPRGGLFCASSAALRR
jgi:hypothetical protein